MNEDFDESEYLRKIRDDYFKLNLTEHQERKLRKIVQEDNRSHTLKSVTNPERHREIMEHLKTPKPRCAYLVYCDHKDCHELTIGYLCGCYGISQGYFRELRQIHEQEWLKEHLEYMEDMYLGDVMGTLGADGDNKEFYEPEYVAKIRSIVNKTS